MAKCKECNGTGKVDIGDLVTCGFCSGTGRTSDDDGMSNLNQDMRNVKKYISDYFSSVKVAADPNTLFAYSYDNGPILKPRIVIVYASGGFQFFSFIGTLTYADLHQNEYMRWINTLNQKSSCIQFTTTKDGSLFMSANYYGPITKEGVLKLVSLWNNDIDMVYSDPLLHQFLAK